MNRGDELRGFSLLAAGCKDIAYRGEYLIFKVRNPLGL
jgi:hypothetical protein